MNASTVTELRSPAVTAVATEVLARVDATELTILGAGVQGVAHARALARVRPFRRIRIVARDHDRAAMVCAALEKELELAVEPGRSAREAVMQSDVVVTATTSTTPVLDRSWIRPGTHINAIGSAVATTRELDSATMAAATLYADFADAVAVEAGDYLFALADGSIGPDHIRAGLGDVLVGRAPARISREQITVFKSIGLAVEDLFAARHAYALAQQQGVGVRVPL
jgi:ornithine cyclodeaminase